MHEGSYLEPSLKMVRVEHPNVRKDFLLTPTISPSVSSAPTPRGHEYERRLRRYCTFGVIAPLFVVFIRLFLGVGPYPNSNHREPDGKNLTTAESALPSQPGA